MLRSVSLLLVSLVCISSFMETVLGAVPRMRYELLDYNPVASSAALVKSDDGKARFTILTPALIRMEYSPSGVFEDRPSLAFVNRDLPVPEFSVNRTKGVLTITTSEVDLTYKGPGFLPQRLSVTSNNPHSAFKSWTAGMTSATDTGNLLGTFRTLDGTKNVTLNCTDNGKPHCEWGLISRSGWALVDDSDNPVLDAEDWWTDANGNLYQRNSQLDWYLFTHGHDYKQALYDYQLVGGKIPVFPRFASGVWWSRWYDLNALDIRKVVDDYRSRSIPLDVFVLDMDWHTKYDWTGYSWDRNLFPYPEDSMSALTSQGLWITTNLHDADGVGNYEDTFDQVCHAMGILPPSVSKVPLDLSNRTYMMALEDIVLKPVEDAAGGQWFAWIDWQQGESGYGTQGGKMNPTIWTDKVRVTDPKRRGEDKRGLVLARFGGLGNHRYQVGFSGDVDQLTWANLAYQPYFSMTASNVGYGFWSHDIEGPGSDHEMFTRWIQWGAWSGIFRTHDRGMSAGSCKNPFPNRDDDENRCSIVQIWNQPQAYFEANRAALQTRVSLTPYIYTHTRAAFDTGISLLRPMYYEYPEEDQAYAADSQGNFPQYFFGQDMMVSPIVSPSDASTLTNATIWIPPGTWVERDSGRVYNGPTLLTKPYELREVPVFVRGGAIIPSIPVMPGDTIAVASRPYANLIFTVYPGADAGTTQVYEDDGVTTGYLQGHFIWTNASYTRTSSTLKMHITRSGTYPGSSSTAAYTLRVANAYPPTSVQVNGQTLKYSRWGGAGTFTYDGNALEAVVECAAVDSNKDVEIVMAFPDSDSDGAMLSGLRGVIARATASKRNLDETRETPGAHTPSDAYVVQLSSLGEALSYLAHANMTAFMEQVNNVTNVLRSAIEQLQGMEPPPPPPPGALVQLYSSNRKDSILCGTQSCMDSQPDYQQIRIEGFQPAAQGPNVQAFNDYWDDAVNDNWATNLTAPPPGYVAASFPNGFVLKEQVEGSVPLYCYYNSNIHDHTAVATADGINYAKNNGYTPCEEGAISGFVFTKPQHSGVTLPITTPVNGIDANRLNYSIALLTSSTL